MSVLKLKTKSDIKNFFKILAEESVSAARSSIHDPKAPLLDDQSELDKKAYDNITTIKEQPEEEAPAEDAAPDLAQPEPGGDLVPDAEEEVAQEPPPPPPERSIDQVNFSSLTSAIKQMRSGLSVDDTAVQNPLRSYFDFLSEPERKALYAFLDALAGIMTQRSTAETAPDPSDPPYNVSMSSGGSGESQSDEAPAQEPEAQDLPPMPPRQDSPEGEAPGAEEEEEEDQGATGGPVPIAAGQPQAQQAISEIRQKVLDLLGKS